MSDRAEEIARGIVLESLQPSTLSNTREERIEQAIAAALRSYGDERVQAFRLRVMHGDHPALVERAPKSKPEIQEGKA